MIPLVFSILTIPSLSHGHLFGRRCLLGLDQFRGSAAVSQADEQALAPLDCRLLPRLHAQRARAFRVAPALARLTMPPLPSLVQLDAHAGAERVAPRADAPQAPRQVVRQPRRSANQAALVRPRRCRRS